MMYEETFKKVTTEYLQNLKASGDMAPALLLSACAGLLSDQPSVDYGNRAYAQIPEVTGGNIYTRCATNIRELAFLAVKKFDPASTEITLRDDVTLPSDKKLFLERSELGVIFGNLRAFENHLGNFDTIPDCLTAWEIFCKLPEKEARMAAFRLCADIFSMYPNATYEATVNEEKE